MSRSLYLMTTLVGLSLFSATSFAGCDTNYSNMLTEVSITNATPHGMYCHVSLNHGVWVNSDRQVITEPQEIYIEGGESNVLLEACYDDDNSDSVSGNVQCTTWYQDFNNKQDNSVDIFKTGYLVSNYSFDHHCGGGLNHAGAGSCGFSDYDNSSSCSPAAGNNYTCIDNHSSISLNGSDNAEEFWFTAGSGTTTPSFPIISAANTKGIN